MKKTLLLVCVLILGLAGFWIWKNRVQNPPTVATTDPYLQELDLYRMKLKQWTEEESSQIPDADIYRAMILLSEVKDPLSLKAGLKAAGAPSQFLREGAAQALGPFDSSDANSALARLLEDQLPSVRQFAIEALGKSSSDERKSLLGSQVGDKNPKGLDRIQWLSARFLQSADDSEKQSALAELAETGVKSKEMEVLEKSIMKMVELAPTAKITTQTLKTIADSDRSSTITAIAIRQLSSQQDSWIGPRLKEFSNHKESIVRKAVVQSLHRNCPRDRWVILKDILQNEKDDSVFEIALEEPTFIPDKEAVPAMKGISSRITTDRLRKIYDGTMKVLTEGSPQNPCGKDDRPDPSL